MNLHFEKKHIILISSMIVLLALLYTGVYFYFLKPLKDDITFTTNQLDSEKKLLEANQQNLDEAKKELLTNTKALQIKVPVEPIMEQFLIDLEKAEFVSNSMIKDITFELQDFSGDEYPSEMSTENVGEQANASTNEETENPSQETKQGLAIPKGLKRYLITLTVDSPSYYELEQFLKRVENTKRLIIIDSLTFNGPQELVSIEEEIKPITYQLTVSVFYFSGLQELSSDLPALEYPEPSNKINPLVPLKSSNQDKQITNDNESTKEQDPKQGSELEFDEKTNEKTVSNVKIHSINKQDTLYSLSKKYYGFNRVADIMSGVEKIKKYNNLSSNLIYAGQKLKIPLE